MNEMVLRRFQNIDQNDIQTGSKLLFESRGIQMADLLSIKHIEEAINRLTEMKYPTANADQQSSIIDMETDKYAQSLIGLALKVKTRKY